MNACPECGFRGDPRDPDHGTVLCPNSTLPSRWSSRIDLPTVIVHSVDPGTGSEAMFALGYARARPSPRGHLCRGECVFLRARRRD